MKDKILNLKTKLCIGAFVFLGFMFFSMTKVNADSWIWPVGGNGGLISGSWPRYSNGNYHSGLDIAASKGTPVFSVCDGIVDSVVSMTTSFGKHIIIRAKVNNEIVNMYYAHLNDFANVSVGEKVSAGQLIGYVGSTGKSSGPHLHYEVRNAQKHYGNLHNPTLNPLLYLPGTNYIFEPNNILSPTNPIIRLNQIWFDMGDTIEVTAKADNATHYFMSLFKEGRPVRQENVNNGVFRIPAHAYEQGDYSVYFSCYNSKSSVDTQWLDFSVVGVPGYTDIRSSKTIYNIRDTIEISVSTICAKGAAIGIDKVGVGRVVTTNANNFKYITSASSLGAGKYSAYFTVYNGSGGIDTTRIEFEIDGDLSPKNQTISANQYWYDVGDTIEITAKADYATGYYMAMFKDGNLIKRQTVEGGTFKISASEYGKGRYSFYFSCYNDYGSIDTTWIDRDVIGVPGYTEIYTLKDVYLFEDTIEISVATVCAKGATIGIDKEGTGRVVTASVENFKYIASASSLGVGKYSAYFSVYNGSGGIDTERVQFEIK